MPPSQYLEPQFLILLFIAIVSNILNFYYRAKAGKYKAELDKIKNQGTLVLDKADHALTNNNISPTTANKHKRSAK